MHTRPASLDNAHVEAGAAHVSENQILLAQFAADKGGAQQAGNRPAVAGFDCARLAYLGHAATRVDHHDRSRIAAAKQLVAGFAQLFPHRLVQIGVEDGGHGAGVLVAAREHLARQDDRNAAEVALRIMLAHDLAHALLMLGMKVGPQQRDHDAARPARQQILHLLGDVVLVERRQHAAQGVDPFAHAHGHVAWDERQRAPGASHVAPLAHWQAIGPLAAAADEDGVLETGGSDEAKPRPLALEQAVERDGGCIANHLGRRKQRREIRAEFGRRGLECAHETNREVVRSGGRLGLDKTALEAHHRVGKSTAHVYVYCGMGTLGGFPNPPTMVRGERSSPAPYAIGAHGSLVPTLAACRRRLSRSSSMSWVGGCPGGSASVSSMVPQPGQ